MKTATKTRSQENTQPAPRGPAKEKSLDEAAARALDQGSVYDLASLQTLREALWAELQKDMDLDKIAKLLGLIIAARRQTHSEGRTSKPQKTEEQIQAEVNALVGAPVSELRMKEAGS